MILVLRPKVQNMYTVARTPYLLANNVECVMSFPMYDRPTISNTAPQELDHDVELLIINRDYAQMYDNFYGFASTKI